MKAKFEKPIEHLHEHDFFNLLLYSPLSHVPAEQPSGQDRPTCDHADVASSRLQLASVQGAASQLNVISKTLWETQVIVIKFQTINLISTMFFEATMSAEPSVMRKIELKHGNGQSSLTVVPFGATIISWIVGGEEMIFVSKTAKMDGSKAIRGGVPICFPNFGPWEHGPQHGFARISKDWKVLSEPKVDVNTGDVQLTMELRDSEETRKMWDKAFTLQLTMTLKAKSVDLNVDVKNDGEEDFDMTFCFHTYFTTPDLSKVEITNLKGLSYTDKTVEGQPICKEENDLVKINGFTDRVYAKAPNQIEFRTGGKVLKLGKSGFADWVVWNPFHTAANMSDMHENGYKEFVCVEATQTTDRILLAKGQNWKASHSFEVL